MDTFDYDHYTGINVATAESTYINEDIKFFINPEWDKALIALIILVFIGILS